MRKNTQVKVVASNESDERSFEDRIGVVTGTSESELRCVVQFEDGTWCWRWSSQLQMMGKEGGYHGSLERQVHLPGETSKNMAKTKTKPGPKPKYGAREEIHVLVPKADLEYIRSVSSNITEWVIKAIQEKRQRGSEGQPAKE